MVELVGAWVGGHDCEGSGETKIMLEIVVFDGSSREAADEVG